MMWRFSGLVSLAVLIAVTVFLSAVAIADGPVLPPATGEACVEPADDMRRYHMAYLKHQRDDTMREGIRGAKYSLTGCASCHAVVEPASDGAQAPSLTPFCGSCHEFAAVTIDCFGCHSPKSGGAKAKGE